MYTKADPAHLAFCDVFNHKQKVHLLKKGNGFFVYGWFIVGCGYFLVWIYLPTEIRPLLASRYSTMRWAYASPTFSRLANSSMVTHRYLTCAYSWAGRLEEALAQAKEILRINPKHSLELYAKSMPFKNKADSERIIEGLRMAGLK